MRRRTKRRVLFIFLIIVLFVLYYIHSIYKSTLDQQYDTLQRTDKPAERIQENEGNIRSHMDGYLENAISYFNAGNEYQGNHLEEGVKSNLECPYLPTRENIIKQYRFLSTKLLKSPNMLNEKIEMTSKDFCLLPTGLLENSLFQEIQNRVKVLRNVCENPPTELQRKFMPFSVIQNRQQNIIICQNAKAASTTIMVYLNILQLFTVVHNHVTVLMNITDHYLLREYTHPAETMESMRMIDWNRGLSFIVARHPFQRLLSCYLNKVKFGRHYWVKTPSLYKEMLIYSKLSQEEAENRMSNELREKNVPSSAILRLQCNSSRHLIQENIIVAKDTEIPTFRGFALATSMSILMCRRNEKCLAQIEIHYMNQAFKCRSCAMEYDAVLKVETLEQDLKFIENLLRTPPIYDMHIKVLRNYQKQIKKNSIFFTEEGMKANVELKDKTYAEYMAQLTDSELNILYTAYYSDFIALNYDPCENIA